MSTVRRIAIAGLGAAARDIHLPAYAGLPVQVVGGCDPAAPGRDFPFPVFASVAEMLEKTRPDILTVAAPPEEHFALVAQGLAAGCHVLCEKPFMPTLEAADRACALALERKRSVVVNNQYRYMDIHREARRRIGTPEFGDLLFVSIQQSFFTTEATEAGWRGRDPRRTWKEFGTHVVDLCRFFFDEDPSAVTARMPRAGGAGPDLLDLVQLEFSRDRVAQVVLDRLCRGPHRYLTVRLDGSAGHIETRLGGGVEARAGVRGGTRRPFVGLDVSLGGRARLFHGERFRKIASEPLDVFARATRRLVAAMLEALDRGAPPPSSAEDNRRTLAAMLAAYESADRRATIPLGG
ncbi:MAG TPA: Gfo/Idh/MocA family oxidoreductase [Vicinamibacteria bacterium]|nr:Gfo/Idh/MocA family oxidoreductase [Vicinamibacteria bacterium]